MRCSDGICRYCNSEVESLQHLFWTCPNAKGIWNIIIPILDTLSVNLCEIDIANPESCALIGFFTKPWKSVLINTIILEAKWYIWKSRNEAKYENKRLDPVLIVKRIKASVHDQIKYSEDKTAYDYFMKYVYDIF